MNKLRMENFTRLTDGQNFVFLDSMEDLVRIRDINGEILFENRAMRELISVVLRKSESQNDISKFFIELYENCKKERGSFRREITIDGRIYAVKASPIYDSMGNVQAFIEVFRDISLERRITRQLYQTTKRTNDDILLAKTIQESILPTKKEYGNLHFDFCHVASENLSGDIYDVIEISEDRVGVYIADVVGHGISASIITMFIRQSMRSILQENPNLSASDTVLKLKESFRQLDLEISQYFTIIYILIDKKEKKMSYVNGGHNGFPIFFNKKNVGFLHNSGKFISNLFEDVEYNENVIDLNIGDRILLYTDGLTETCDAKGNFFGEKRLINWVRKNRKAKNFVQKLLHDVDNFRARSQNDDIAIVYLEIKETN